MDKASQLTILLSGMAGLALAVLTTRLETVRDAVVAVIAGLFGSLVIAPAVAEGLTKFALTFPSFAWLNAEPGNALFTAIVGIGGLLGGQIVITVKSDFMDWMKRLARRRLKMEKGDD